MHSSSKFSLFLPQLKTIISIAVLFASTAASAFYREEFISAPGLFPANHSSSLIEVTDQQLLSCWYAGSREGGKDVQIYCSHKNQDQSWTAPSVAVRRGEKARGALIKNSTVANPILFKQDNGRIWLVYAIRPFGGWLMSHIDYKYSDDGGLTWSSSRRLVSRYGHLPRTKPLRIDSETYWLPLYQEFPKRGYVATLKIDKDRLKILETNYFPGKEHIQPSLVPWGQQIFAYLRSGKSGHVLMSTWDSSKKLWSEPQPVADLANPNSSVDALPTNSGEVLIAYNSHSSERSPLSLALSKNGHEFKHIFDVEPFGPNREYSYPSLTRTSDGRYHLTYTYDGRSAIKHVTFDENWLNEHR